MKGNLRLLVVTFLMASILASACTAVAPTPNPAADKPGESKPVPTTATESKPGEKPVEVKPGADKGPIKIGYMVPLTGPFGVGGVHMREGFLGYLAQKGNQFGGRTIQVIVEDTEGNPDVGLTKAKKLVERDNVDLLAGVLSSGVAYALSGYVCH